METYLTIRMASIPFGKFPTLSAPMGNQREKGDTRENLLFVLAGPLQAL